MKLQQLILPALAATTIADKCSTLRDHARNGIDTLMKDYNHDCGLWGNCMWWTSANMLTTLADYVAHTPSEKGKYTSVFAETFHKAQRQNLDSFHNQGEADKLDQTKPAQAMEHGFTNQFHDDAGWWALAWVKVYDVTHEKRYLDAAKYIFTNMTTGWSDKCNGGVDWKTDSQYKNAITNELFIQVAAELAKHAVKGSSDYKNALSWAKRGADWLLDSSMIDGNKQITDGLQDEGCSGSGQPLWTYNQGAILNGLAVLNELEPNQKYAQAARDTAHAAIDHMTQNDVLKESCEPNCDGDSVIFKGVVPRNIQKARHLLNDDKIMKFINDNADAVWDNARKSNGKFALSWTDGQGQVSTATHSSGLDAIVAAMIMNDCSEASSFFN